MTIKCEIDKTTLRENQGTKVKGGWVNYSYYKTACDVLKKRVDSIEEIREVLADIEKERVSIVHFIPIYWFLKKKKELTNDSMLKDIAKLSVKLFKKYPNCLELNERTFIYNTLKQHYIDKYKDKYEEVTKDWRELPYELSFNKMYINLLKRDWILTNGSAISKKQINKEHDRLGELLC